MLGRLLITGFAAVCGFLVGSVFGVLPYMPPNPDEVPSLAELIPLPHHVPEHSGGISFRFAMAHDVIHERFPKHGPAHYTERDRLTREALAKLDANDPGTLPLLDDLAVGQERLGKSAEAVQIMREKLALQRKLGIEGRDLYTTFANLGTFLIHGSFKRAMAGDTDAKDRFREGVQFIRESVKVNPEAHFGRERWQAAIAEFLLASMDNPKLLTTFDCLGNRLDTAIDKLLDRENNWTETGYGRPSTPSFGRNRIFEDFPSFLATGVDLGDPNLWLELHPIRKQITKVGAEAGWDDVPVPSHRVLVPFDEPVLGMIGMWRQGGGANPHFCLALGETMLRVGQRPIAWAAFERAGRLAERFWPDPSIQKSLREHARKRQDEIEQSLSSDEAPARKTDQASNISALAAELLRDFDHDLAFGEAYQRDYQEYEKNKIDGGVSIDDDHFFDQFTLEHPSIASPSGTEEAFASILSERLSAYAVERGLAWGIFGAGVAATLVAGCFWLLRWIRRPAPTQIPEV